jgi:hypothetical protein
MNNYIIYYKEKSGDSSQVSAMMNDESCDYILNCGSYVYHCDSKLH